MVLVVYTSWTGRMGLEHGVCYFCGSTGGRLVALVSFLSSFYVSVDVRWVVANVVDSGCGNAYNGGRNVCVAQGFLVFDERRTRLFPVSRQSTYAPPHCALSLQVPSINCVDSFQLTFYACPLH